MKRLEPISRTRLLSLSDRTTAFAASPAVYPWSRLLAFGAVALRNTRSVLIKRALTRLFCLVAVFVMVFLFYGVVDAQPRLETAQVEQSPENRSRVFEAVEGMQVEEVSGAKLLLAAYALFWLLLFAYVVRLARIQVRTRDDLDRLERLLTKVERSECGEDKPELE